MIWIILGIIFMVLFIGFVFWCCCKSASNADKDAYRIIERKKKEEEI